MISNFDKDKILKKLGELEKERYLFHSDDLTIGIYCKNRQDNLETLKKSNDSLSPILRTALVINWREELMQKRYARFREHFPHIKSLLSLKKAMGDVSALGFCKEYLDINANPMQAEKNPKYMLLKELTEGFLEYQQKSKKETEIEAIRDWASNLNMNKLNEDFIGRRHGVGPGVVENIRLNLGCSVIKPDRHVIGVLKKIFYIDFSYENYKAFAKAIEVDPFYLDCLLFKYGKIKGISSNKVDRCKD